MGSNPPRRWQPGQSVFLKTRRLVVRTLTDADVGATLLEWTSDPVIAENVWHPQTDLTTYFRGLVAASDQRTRFCFLIIHGRSNQPIGYIKLLVDVERRTQIPTIVLGERDFWNAELGTEAVRAVQRFAFEHLPVDQIESRVYAENQKVRQRLSRFGYQEVDVASEIVPGRRLRKVHVYRIDKESWLARSPDVEAHLARQPDEPV